MDRAQGWVTGAVVGLWLTLHLVECAATLALGAEWRVPPEVDVAMGSTITFVLGGPKVLRALGKANGNGNGNGQNGKKGGEPT